MARTLYHRGVILLYPLFGGSMGGHNRSGRCGDEKAVIVVGMSCWWPSHGACRGYAVSHCASGWEEE